MFSEILKIQPKIDGGDLNKMESLLNSRFAKVAKKFGSGITSIFRNRLDVLAGLVNKILNPLDNVRDAIEKSLHIGDDLVTNAKQFGTTPGNLARLHAFGKATGLDPEEVNLLLVKFQEAVANQALTPDQRTSVYNFQGRKDTAEAFFEFIQSMQSLTDVQKSLVQQEVFGGKQILKASAFLNAKFPELNEKFSAIGTPSTETITGSANWLNQMNENRNIFRAATELSDLPKKGKLIGDAAINRLNKSDIQELTQTNKQLSQAANLEIIAQQMQKIADSTQDFFLKAAPLVAYYFPLILSKLESGKNAIENSRAARGIMSKVPGGGN